MRRSQAPSQRRLSGATSPRSVNAAAMAEGSIQVVQAPILSCLTVPKAKFCAPRIANPAAFAAMSKQAQRRRGTLGARKRLRTGPLLLSAKRPAIAPSVSSDDGVDVSSPVVEAPELPKAEPAAPAKPSSAAEGYDPVVLWVPEEAGGIAAWDEEAEAVRADGGIPVAPPGSVVVDPCVGRFLRPHQREGMRFLWDCVSGVRVSQTGPGVLGLGKGAKGKGGGADSDSSSDTDETADESATRRTGGRGRASKPRGKARGGGSSSAAAAAAAAGSSPLRRSSRGGRRTARPPTPSDDEEEDTATSSSEDEDDACSADEVEVTGGGANAGKQGREEDDGDVTEEEEAEEDAGRGGGGGGDERESAGGGAADVSSNEEEDEDEDEEDDSDDAESDDDDDDAVDAPASAKKTPFKPPVVVAATNGASSSSSSSSDASAPLAGAILADDMGLGKTLQSVTLLWTCLQQGPNGSPLARRAIVVTPTSLVANWSQEIHKWLGNRCPHVALSEACRAKVTAGISEFLSPRGPRLLILSYETFRMHAKRLTGPAAASACDLLICDEAHRLKNDETQTARALSGLSTRRRVLLSGTPIQNNLDEFFAMANFCNPGVLGTPKEFHRHFESPILEAREPGASDASVRRSTVATDALSTVVNQFVLRRTNALLSDHLPPKLVQVVVCPLSPLQRQMYEAVLATDAVQSILRAAAARAAAADETAAAAAAGRAGSSSSSNNHDDDDDDDDDEGGGALSEAEEVDEETAAAIAAAAGGSRRKATGALPVINTLRKICNHPSIALQSAGDSRVAGVTSALRDTMLAVCDVPDALRAAASGYGLSRRRGGGVDASLGGKISLLASMLELMRARGTERIVIVSVTTQTLDLVGQLCQERGFPVIRLDGSISAGKRQQLVDRFNDASRDEFVFLLSSKAGGCGLNLVGASRLVLLDCDWNPAVDKQAAARVWRDGQKRRVFVYRFLARGTLEEKIFQRQLSKEGLHTIVVEEKAEAVSIASEALRDLFQYDAQVESDTHRAIRCRRCFRIEDAPPGASQEDPSDAKSDPAEPVKPFKSDAGAGSTGPPGVTVIDDDDDDDVRSEAGGGGDASGQARAACSIASQRRQLGSPEEADLLRWSHHSDISTIAEADSILADAAAMAPPEAPTVSFVFGLQVRGKSIVEADPAAEAAAAAARAAHR